MAGDNGGMTDEQVELLQALIDTECPEEVNLAEAFAKQQLDATAMNAIKGALRLMSGVKDKLSPEMRGALDKLANVAGYPSPGSAKAAHDDDKPKPGEAPMSKAQDPKPGDPTPTPEVPTDVEAFMKAQNIQIEALTKTNEATVAAMEEMRKERTLEGFQKRAKDELAFCPGASTDDMGQQLADIHAVSPDQAESMFKTMKAASDAFEKSAALAGTGGGGGPSIPGGGAGATVTAIHGVTAAEGSALAEMQKLADEQFAKAGDGETKEQSFAKALRANPALYRRFLEETPALTSVRAAAG